MRKHAAPPRITLGLGFLGAGKTPGRPVDAGSRPDLEPTTAQPATLRAGELGDGAPLPDGPPSLIKGAAAAEDSSPAQDGRDPLAAEGATPPDVGLMIMDVPPDDEHGASPRADARDIDAVYADTTEATASDPAEHSDAGASESPTPSRRGALRLRPGPLRPPGRAAGNGSAGGTAPRRRFTFHARWTVGLKLAILSAIGLMVALVVGGVSYTSVDKIKEASELRTVLAIADSELTKLDKLSSDAQVYERDMLMAADDSDREKAINGLAATREAADAHWKRIEELPLSADLKDPLSKIHNEYDSYMQAITDELPILGSLGVTSPEAIIALAREQGRADAVRQQLRPVRELMTTRDREARIATLDRIEEVKRTVLVAGLIGLASLLIASVLISRSITGRLRALRVRMAEIADGDGDLTARLSERAKDETGDVARAANRFIARVQELVAQMADAGTALAGSVDSLSQISSQLADNAESTSSQATTASTAAEEVSHNVQAVAGSAEEMGASIREIASNATEAARVAHEASLVAQSVSTTVAELGQSSNEISVVVDTITSIAKQTNLLALNATIEAARAGEYGRGFGVVATEVKDLAQATAKATEDISLRISAIQTTTDAAVTAIAQIVEIVERINDYSTTIASSVEEQTATTTEISRNVAEAASGSSNIARNIHGVAESADMTADAAVTAAETTNTVSGVVTDLQAAASRFRY